MAKLNMPNILGVVDGTHIAIERPIENDPQRPANAYFNRKQFYSINTQIVSITFSYFPFRTTNEVCFLDL